MGLERKTMMHMDWKQKLETQLEHYLSNEPILAGALTGISIRLAVTGEKLYDRIGDTRLRPASNMKLLTGAAALSVLGENYSFSTEMLTDGFVDGSTLQGNLYLKGKGDPTILPADFDAFAEKIQKLGIKKIEGNLIADDTWYDDVRLSPNLIWSDEQYYYGAQVSALTVSPNEDFDTGSVIIMVSPGSSIGEKPIVTVSPETSYVKVENEAITVPADEEENLIIGRVHAGNTITINGTIPQKHEQIKEWMSVWEPTMYALACFQCSLGKYGITWTGHTATGQAKEDSRLLYVRQSMPLSELLIPFMKLSNNGHAEILVKEMGKVVHGIGSWEKGLEVLVNEIKKFGIDTDTMVLRDGSGISHLTLIPPNEISKLLYNIQEKAWFPAFLHSLPIAGMEERMVGGTLRERMYGLAVQAKTGTIGGVSSLSGYVETKDHGKLIFSIMMNNLLDEEEGPAIGDKIVEIIANH